MEEYRSAYREVEEQARALGQVVVLVTQHMATFNRIYREVLKRGYRLRSDNPWLVYWRVHYWVKDYWRYE